MIRPDNRWVRTTKRLPDPGTDVLCAWLLDGKPTLQGVATFAGGEHWHEPEDDEDDYAVPDYWMELPVPPK